MQRRSTSTERITRYKRHIWIKREWELTVCLLLNPHGSGISCFPSSPFFSGQARWLCWNYTIYDVVWTTEECHRGPRSSKPSSVFRHSVVSVDSVTFHHTSILLLELTFWSSRLNAHLMIYAKTGSWIPCSGDYPHQMHEILGPNLPKFIEEEKQLLKNQIDFIGINHYNTFYVKDCIYSLCDLDLYTCEALVSESSERNGIPIGKPVKVCIVHCIILFIKNPISKLILHNLPLLN